MKITEKARDRVKVLTLEGKLTLGLGDMELQSRMSQVVGDGARAVVLNMHGVTVVDSSGVGALVSAHTSMQRNDGRMALSNVPPKCMDLLMMTQLITVFDVYDTEDEAVAALA